MKRKNKQGISLIVLVITIIVMIILAAAVILSLSSNGIIGRANEAVKKMDLKQVQIIAQTIWADGYLAAEDETTIKNKIITAIGGQEVADKYNINVTPNGVTVEEKGGLNEYGFYYDTPYVSEEENGMEYYCVFKAEGRVEWYVNNTAFNNFMYDGTEEAQYEKGKIIYDDYDKRGCFSLAKDTYVEEGSVYEYEYVYTTETYRDVYYNERYCDVDLNGSIVIREDNSIERYKASGSLKESIEGTTVTKSSHLFEYGSGYSISVSMDGKILKYNGETYKLVPSSKGNLKTFSIGCGNSNHKYNTEWLTLYFEEGMTFEEWMESEYNVIKATIGEISDEENFVSIPCDNTTHCLQLGNFVEKDEEIIPGQLYRMDIK